MPRSAVSGVGCAYTLQKSGFDVVLYEARDKLGGNAQVLPNYLEYHSPASAAASHKAAEDPHVWPQYTVVVLRPLGTLCAHLAV